VGHAGHGRTDGALRAYVAWPDRCLFPVPAGMSAAEAALLEPLAVALHALDLGHMREGLTIRIVRRLRGTFPRAIAMVESGGVDLANLVTATYPLAEAAKALRTAEARTGM